VARNVAQIGPLDYLLRVLPGSVSFVDPSLDGKVRYIPLLQPNVTDDIGFLRADLDFDIVRSRSNLWAYLRFEDQPVDRLWAEATALDGQLLQKLFAPLTGIADLLESSDGLKLKTQIIGALYGLISGPHLGPLSAAVGGLLGAPIAVKPGIVLDFTSLAGHPAIVIEEVDRERVYPYPKGIKTVVSIGDAVEKFDPLVELPKVHDWVTAPVRLANAVTDEMQKYSRVLTDVQVEYLMAEYRELPRPLTNDIISAFSFKFSQRIRKYLLNAVGVWCGLLDVLVNLLYTGIEELEVTDDIQMSGRRHEGTVRVMALPANPLNSPVYTANPVIIGQFILIPLAESLQDSFTSLAMSGFTYEILEYSHAVFPRRRTQLTAREALTGALDPRYDHGGMATVGSLPTSPEASPVYLANPVIVGQTILISRAEELTTSFSGLGMAGFSYSILEYEDEALYYQEPPVGDSCPPSNFLYDQAEIWVLDSRTGFNAKYTGTNTGNITTRIYKTEKVLSHGQTEWFYEPDYWDECDESDINLDFSRRRNSHHVR
jgi:hypothetical protein